MNRISINWYHACIRNPVQNFGLGGKVQSKYRDL